MLLYYLLSMQTYHKVSVKVRIYSSDSELTGGYTYTIIFLAGNDLSVHACEVHAYTLYAHHV